MKNLKKITRDQMKSINGGLGCAMDCCPPPGVKKCPKVVCVIECPILI